MGSTRTLASHQAAPSPGDGRELQTRHAQVLPAFAVAFMRRPLDSRYGPLSARELLAWPHPTLLSERAATLLRGDFVRRRRTNFDPVWNATVGVHLVPQWRDALDRTTRERVERFLLAGGAQLLTRGSFRDIKHGLALPIAECLRILSRLEALYWVSGALPQGRRATRTLLSPEGQAAVPLEPAFVARLQSALTAPWVTRLDSADLRFPFAAHGGFAAWVQALLHGETMPASAYRTCERLVAAAESTWRSELTDVVRHAIELASPGPGGEEAKARWIAIFLARYGGRERLTLQAVGDRYGITRERVRQIGDAILAALKTQPMALPALDRLFAAAERVMPMSVDEADEQLRRFLGEGTGLAAALHFAEDVGVAAPISLRAHRARTNEGYRPVMIVDRAPDAATWVNAALAYARRDCTFVGCSSFIRIAGLLALDHAVAVDGEALRTVFREAPGYRALDASATWFTLADSELSAAATRVRKLMAVANGEVDLDTIASALMTDDRWLHRDGERGLGLPPLHVLGRLLAGWSWLAGNAHHRFTARAPIEASSVLSPTEQCVLAAAETRDGVVTRAEIVDAVAHETGASIMAVSLALAQSPTVVRIDNALYAIRGRALSAEGLRNARERRQRALQRRPAALTQALDALERRLPVRITLTQSASTVPVTRRVVYLPRSPVTKLAGRFTDARGESGDIDVKSNGQILRLAAAAERSGIQPGQRFEVAFDMHGRTFEVLPAVAAAEAVRPKRP